MVPNKNSTDRAHVSLIRSDQYEKSVRVSIQLSLLNDKPSRLDLRISLMEALHIYFYVISRSFENSEYCHMICLIEKISNCDLESKK
jgi:hypothetical protein